MNERLGIGWDADWGKSSLLMSILEETTLVEGKVRVKAHKVCWNNIFCVSCQ
jgi:hypothetical protein